MHSAEINEMLIKMPSGNGIDGNILATEVAKRVSDTFPESAENQFIPELNIQISDSKNMGMSDLAEKISDQIIQQIKLAII